VIPFVLFLLAIVPVLAGAVHGHRLGFEVILRGGTRGLLLWGVFALATASLYSLHVFTPLGLITPVVGGVVALALARYFLPGRGERALVGGQPPSFTSRAAGSVLGAAAGALVAGVGGLGLSFAAAYLSPVHPVATRGERTSESTSARSAPLVPADTARPASQEDAPPVAQAAGLAGEEGLAQAILRTVNHGLVRHVPVVGSLSDEAEALGKVLRSSTSERVELARELGWEPLGKLATFQAILDDGPLLEDVDRGAGGDLLALYRLQSNERIIAFWKEEAVQQAIRGLRPTRLAEMLRNIQGEAALSAAKD